MVRERLGDFLADKGWSASELARRLDEHRNWVLARLNGDTDIKAEELLRLAEVLQIDPAEFFSAPGSPPAFVLEPANRVLQDAIAIAGGLTNAAASRSAPLLRWTIAQLTDDEALTFVRLCREQSEEAADRVAVDFSHGSEGLRWRVSQLKQALALPSASSRAAASLPSDGPTYAQRIARGALDRLSHFDDDEIDELADFLEWRRERQRRGP